MPQQAVADQRSSFRFFSVAPPLDRYVDHLFVSVLAQGFMDQITAVRLPEVEAQLVFAIEEGHAFPGWQSIGGGFYASLFLQPAHLRVIAIPGTIREAVGASLRAAGLRLLLPRGAGDLTSAPLIPLDDLCGASGRTLRDRLIEEPGPLERVALLRAYLNELARRAERAHSCALHAVRLLEATDGEISVEALARSCGVTSRTLRNVLLSETGMPAKQLARVSRIRRALHLIRQAGAPPDGASICNSFADQAHMCREFRSLLGMTPGTLGREIYAPQRALPSYRSERELVDTGLLILARPPEG